MEIDNTYRDEGKPMRRFFLRRLKDETGVSRTGRVLEGVLTQSGKVITEWRPPHSTIGVYNSFEEFMLIHVDCHPSCNEVVWLDYGTKVDEHGKTWAQDRDGTWGTVPGTLHDWHCFACGAAHETGNFCSLCGAHASHFHGAFDLAPRLESAPALSERGETTQ